MMISSLSDITLVLDDRFFPPESGLLFKDEKDQRAIESVSCHYKFATYF